MVCTHEINKLLGNSCNKQNRFVMKRRSFLANSMAAGLVPLSLGATQISGSAEEEAGSTEEVVVEKFHIIVLVYGSIPLS